MHSKVGTCLQCGLMGHPELLYLVWPTIEFDVMEIAEEFRVPDSILSRYDEWRYFGMDADPTGMANLLRQYREQDNVGWIVGCLGESTFVLPGLDREESLEKPLVYFPAWMSVADPAVERPHHFYGLKIGLSDLVRSLGLTELAVLWLDIEGSEFSVLEQYDWHLRPEYLAVEVHCYPEPVTQSELSRRVARMESIVGSQGYRRVRSERSNFHDGQYHTHDLQFIREDVV